MAFYKICPECGTENAFAARGKAPRLCEKCGRSLTGVPTMSESERARSTQDEPEAPCAGDKPETPCSGDEPAASDTPCACDDEPLFYLEEASGKFRIPIPPCGGSVGRGALGGEALLPYCAVSRKHIRVRYRGKIGLTIEDTSRYGASVNGEPLTFGTARFVREGDEIRLYDLPLVVHKAKKTGE